MEETRGAVTPLLPVYCIPTARLLVFYSYATRKDLHSFSLPDR